ncbi:hypothetical protein QAD02_020563 [Eretmocerus hayati]|uniref:Uncharacterized protein n=1 Tax=Eretmocerus hayati TaxID=131215 RepID=A0ACC2PMV8_9HYME|nr:hypothetical protein QAD02_020563 [Eretmocerus hayati]
MRVYMSSLSGEPLQVLPANATQSTARYSVWWGRKMASTGGNLLEEMKDNLEYTKSSEFNDNRVKLIFLEDIRRRQRRLRALGHSGGELSGTSNQRNSVRPKTPPLPDTRRPATTETALTSTPLHTRSTRENLEVTTSDD